LRIAFVAERPTQFEAPFFRFAARDSRHALEAYFTDPLAGRPVRDPELGREVDWGFDLLQGYASWVAPRGSGLAWWDRRLAAGRYDLVVVNGYTRVAYLRAALAARRHARRTALRLDTVLFGRRPSALRRLLVRRLLGALFDRWLATGSLSRAYLEACGLPPARVGMWPYAIDVDAFRLGAARPAVRAQLRAQLGLRDGEPTLLAVCKLSPREAPWDLIRAAELLGAAGPRILIAGDGPQRARLEARARQAASNRIAFLGYVPYRELPALYACADLFVHAPREERWGVSVAEAMAAGLPVVSSTRVGAAHDLVVPGGNGFLYDAGDVLQLAALVRDALALSPQRVGDASRVVLERWGYEAAWRGLVGTGAAG
jgi:glycosyltransferase involved in cell wall biosynthesis